ncbi:dynein heavy chain domain-containing protein 1-like [Ostrea edulis]|uniref:dynein heavy chain domain-containing protein 1-like n=1 Tax=Ostrea edulis TaxID=37623 RepID=UPI0024AEE1DC|nr:dynein heavy chain domain-containing protein 1-like [Ostrea edulis]
MSSRLDLPQMGDQPSSLPVLREGQNSLVSPSRSSQSLTPRQQAATWAVDVRKRINLCMEAGQESKQGDIAELKQELVGVFITALQQNSRPGWVYLHEVLSLVEPYKAFLNQLDLKLEFNHYLERILQSVDLQKEKLFDLQLGESLGKVFPDEVQRLRQSGAFPARNYCVTPARHSIKAVSLCLPPPKTSIQSPRKNTLPDGTNPYKTHVPHDDRQMSLYNPLTLGDLQKSIANVASELAASESIWTQKSDGGRVALALNTDLPHEVKPKPPPSQQSTPRSSISSLPPKKEKKTPRIQEEPVLKLTGRDAVEYFAKCHHIGKIQSIYFNHAESRHFRPYDLISVHKNKANPEHYVFSTFGVLHVFPNRPAESQSLSEWQREAVLWKAVSSIPFFKNFLVRKMFYRWRYNKLHLDFSRRHEDLGANLLQGVPIFGAALLQVSRLLKELITVKFLPFETDKTYQLLDFENSANYKNIQAEKILDRFFGFCKMVVEVTAEESFKKLRHCEEQVKKKTVFSKDSLHLQKLKKETREYNLRKAKSETGRLGNFVKLVDQLIVEHMFDVCKTQVMTFVERVLSNQEESREGLFRANLVFTKQEILGIFPSKERFSSVLMNTLKGIPSVLCSKAIPMDGSVMDPDSEESETSPPKSELAKSTAELSCNIPGRRKSTAATNLSSIKLDQMTSQAPGEGEKPSSSGETTEVDQGEEESQVGGVTRSVVGEEMIPVPDIYRQATATKDEDELGVATPDLIIQGGDPLVVYGEGFMGQYSPLTRANLEEKLDKDIEYKSALKREEDILNAALDEIDNYCTLNNWLVDIYKFCVKWTSDSPKEYRGAPAFTIEQRLIEVRQWQEKVRNFDKSFITDNGIFYVDCSNVHDSLIPRLSQIVHDVLQFVSDEARKLATEFCDEMKEVLQNLRQKDSSMAGFAVFAKNYTTYKKNGPQYQQRVSYIKSLYETSEEEKFDEDVQAAWEAYLLQLQDASEFVNTQTPLMTQKLEDKYQRLAKAKTLKQKIDALKNPSLYMRLEKEALELADMATTKQFLDPTQNPTKILIEMRRIRDRFYEVEHGLQDASKWRDAICGEPYDLDFLSEISTKMDVRQELWKYVEVSMHAIKDCKIMLFKKMNIRKVLEKVTEWQAAAGQLKPYLPLGDQVLSYWFTCLGEFKKDLPILHKLANDALKERHWKAIFVGMNEPFDPNREFTVSDLLAYDLEQHNELIHQVYLGAIAEYDLELRINQISKFWEEQEFKLAKHIPDSVITSKEQVEKHMLQEAENEPPRKPSSPRRRTKLEKYRQERAAAQTGAPQGLDVTQDDFFILIEVDELKYQLEDARISIRSMLQSPYLGDMRQEVEFWDSALQQVEEITELWFQCQKKWLYLLKIFERPEMYKKFNGQAFKFENLHTKFKDWMRVVSNNSKVMTVVGRKRGEKGFRLLQGDYLINMFLELNQKQEEILKFLRVLLENSRMEFPRLYFLSDEDLVELLGISRNPKALLPFAKMCFPGIETLNFTLPDGISSMNTALDFALNADKLQVTALKGIMGEEIELVVRVQAFPKASKWLKTLENVMKNTTAMILQACVQTRMEEGSRQPIHILEELSKLDQDSPRQQDLTREIHHTFRHWLLRFPVQYVIVTEGILWERSINKALERGTLDDIKAIRSNLQSKLDQYTDILRESHNFNGKVPPSTKHRLHTLLCGLINQCCHHRDVLGAMLEASVVSDGGFEWLRVLRYHMDIQNVLRAKTEAVEVKGQSPAVPSVRSRAQQKRLSLVTKIRMEPTLEEPPRLTRTKTTVSTDYQFSACYLTQLGTSFNYDYEYHGPSMRLVLTPLTERAFLSLTQAIKNFHCGTLVGPSGVGKSETVKELAKMFGRNLFLVNCNEDITVGVMMQYMMGMAQSGSWTLFDDTDRLTKGLMSVTAQHLDYLKTALKTLEVSSENQYKIRGQPRFDKKMGLGDKVIRRNSLTTLHPMPTQEAQPGLERQKTVPHGFNEKGLVTYFEDTWVSEKDRRRRHSIEKEIEIKESEFYKNNKPPPLFYEHVKLRGGRKSATPDYSKLLNDTIYVHRILGNIMFNGKLIQASTNFGCFMTLSNGSAVGSQIPESFKLLMRPCAMIVPDFKFIVEMFFCFHGYQEIKLWTRKLTFLFEQLRLQLPRRALYQFGLKDIKLVLDVAATKVRDQRFALDITAEDHNVEERKQSPTSPVEAPPVDPRQWEEYTLVYALRMVVRVSMENTEDYCVFDNILRDVFPSTARKTLQHDYDNQLMEAIHDQLKEDHLKDTPGIVQKVMQLNSALQLKKAVVLIGPAGSGKTTCSQTLARATNRLNFLLFAPDHSKDELTTNRDLIYYAKNKLKDVENEPELADDVFLAAIDPSAKTEMSQAGKKMKRITTILGKVTEAINEMQHPPKPQEYAEHPKINVVTLNPTALSPQEFLGSYDNGMWKGGLFPKILQDSGFLCEAVRNYIAGQKDRKARGGQELPSILLRWIVLDGVMHPVWTESLNTLFDEELKLSLANSQHISLSDTTAMMFETSYIGNISPATISRCTILNFAPDTVPWMNLYDCWAKDAKTRWMINTSVMKIFDELVADVFQPTLKFLKSDCCPALLTDVGHDTAASNEVAPGIQEVGTFLKILTVLLDRLYLREEFERRQKTLDLGDPGIDSPRKTPSSSLSRQSVSRMTSSSQLELVFPNYMENMKGMFAYAFVWSFGGHLHERYKEKFSKFANDVLYRARHAIKVPIGASVFDYVLDESTGTFIRWSDKSQERMKILAGGFTITPEVEKYTHMVELMLSAHQPVLLSGMPGVGKTSLLQTMVLPKQTHTRVVMSQAMSSQLFLNSILGQIMELKHRATNTLTGPGQIPQAPKGKQSHLFFIDDLNMAASNPEGGYQPPLELLRQILTQKGTYDRGRLEFQCMDEAMFLASTTLPSVPGAGLGTACHVMSSRLTRLFINFTLFTPTTEVLMSMHGRNIQHWLEEFPTYSIDHHFELSRAMTLGLLEIYHKIKEKLRPTPTQAHYVFNLHDVARVIHGILLMSPRSRTRKMMRRKKGDSDSRGSRNSIHMSRQASWDSKSRTVSVSSMGPTAEVGQSAPMMKVIGQLWCHEVTRTFADRLISEDDVAWYGRILEEVVTKYFCMPRDDPKTEMAAISEETYSQTGRMTPTTLSPHPPTPDESDEDPAKEEDVKETEMDVTDSTDAKSESEETGQKSVSTETPQGFKSVSVETPQGQKSQYGETPLPFRESADTGKVTVGSEVTRQTETEGISSEYESEVSEESSDESEVETTTTETEYETPIELSSGQNRTGPHPQASESSGLTVASVKVSSGKSKASSSKSDTTSELDTSTLTPARLAQHQESLRSDSEASALGKSSSTPNLKNRGSHGNLKMKTVTFKAGLLADWEHEAYFGPLMNLDEIKGSNDSLMDIIFSKFFMTTYTETQGLPVEKGYVEGTEDNLSEALSTCLSVYNEGTSQKMDLVFFSDAVRHAARLSRVLAIQGGHAILLGMSYSTGRATLARLAAYIAHCKLFEPKPQTDPSKNLQILREHIKRACYHTGILGKPTVLLVHEDLGEECLQDVTCLMNEGTSPGLYTDEEIQNIVSAVMPGGVTTKRVDKIEIALERFLKKIRQNIHVIVCMNYRGNSYCSDSQVFHNRLMRYPGLLKNASAIDTYRPWNYQAYVRIANVWLRDQKTGITIPWHPTRMLDQILQTSRAMAYIHMSAKSVIERQYCNQREPLRFFSPLTFMEFVHVFRVLTAFIVKREYENISKHEQTLGKVNEAFGSISELKREVSELMPKHKAAMAEIKELVQQVEEQKQQYIQALERCKSQEQKIEHLQGPLEELRREAQTEFDKPITQKKSIVKRRRGEIEYYTLTQYKVNPNYHAAMTALKYLCKGDIEEVKSYRLPPELVEFVLNSLCLLFDVPQDWENAKLLMIKDNFLESMMFYDKDNIPDDIYLKLRQFINHPDFQVDRVAMVSKAAAGICMWVHAVYEYAHIHRNMQPRLRNLLEHEDKFTLAQAKLGQLRVEANRIKSALESKITVHRAAVKRAKTIEKHMQSIEKKIARSVNLMEHMSMQHYLWKSELRKAKHNVLTAPGDALITAACVLYHGPLSDRNRSELLHDWLDRCRQGNFNYNRLTEFDVNPLSTNLESLYEGIREKDSTSTASSVRSTETATSGLPSMPEIRTFMYLPSIYDTSKYYKSELKKQGSMEYETIPEADDSDDDDEASPLITRNGYLLQEILSDFDELSGWRLTSLPTDLHSVQNALLMRVSCHNRKHCWPLLIDPDNQAEIWVTALQTSRNVFSERDVRDHAPEYDDMPLEVSPSKDTALEPPPSRGTALTYSSEFTLNDDYRTDTTGFVTATSTYTTATKSVTGRQSHNTFNSEELRPLTSVTASWETLSHLLVEQAIERPENNLWIMEADDPNLDSRIITAVVHGVTVLVTHLERKPLDPVYRGLLLKQFFVDKEGHRVVKVGQREFRYHPEFALYLSTSVPLFLKGDGIHSIPLHRMCIINMSLSDEAIINHLLIETMKVERKEFEGQKRSNENDIILHRQRLAKEHDMIREKTLNLEGPLLEDQTMLKSLLECQAEVEKNRQILEETRFMGDHLEEKFAHYMPMIMQSAVLYNMIRRMCSLNSNYYLPFHKFIQMYTGIIRTRNRGKGSSVGAPQARAQELMDATSNAIFKYISMMMFEQHFTLLQLLVSMERMRMSRKASTKELSLFINGFDKQGLDELTLLECKPAGMTNQAWIDCLVVEQLHHPFNGLRRSLIQNWRQWEEYFSHPITLVNPVPGSTLQELSIFQKCILWKICRPDRLYELASMMTLYELGNVRLVADHYNIREVYNFTEKTTPVVFISPNQVTDIESCDGTNGYPYISPSHEVKRLAKEVGMEGRVKVMNFGVKGQIGEVTQAIEDCIQNGYWLLLQNYHLSEEPHPQFFTLLKDIVYSKWIEHERLRQHTEVADEGASLVTHSKPPDDPMLHLRIHNTFRLWITTQANSKRLIPGVLVQHGIKVTCEKTGNFKSTLQKSYRSVAFLLNNCKLPNDEVVSKASRIMPLALLHSLLQQQSFYGRNAFVQDNDWTLTDLALAVDAFKKVMTKCPCGPGVSNLVSQVYSNHCTDLTDARVVEAHAKLLSQYAADPANHKLPATDSPVITLLSELLKSADENFNLKKAVEAMGEVSAKTYGLSDAADANIIARYSRAMSKDIVQVIGAPELLMKVTTTTAGLTLTADSVFPAVSAAVQKLTKLPDTHKNHVSPVDTFIHSEVEGYKTLVEKVQSDLAVVQRSSKGEAVTAQTLRGVTQGLNADQVPEAWLSSTFPSCISLTQWIKEIPNRLQTISVYVSERPGVYNVASFLRPDRFFEAVKHQYARKHFKDVNSIQLEIQVMPAGLFPSTPPKDGVFISGLRLYNALWDTIRGMLMSGASDKQSRQDMPVIWLKPYDVNSPSKVPVKHQQYSCPLYCSADQRCHSYVAMVTELSLPTLLDPSVWHQNRVFLATII